VKVAVNGAVKRLLLAILLLVPALQAEAHRFAPSLLRVFEVADREYQVIWKTPAQRVSEVPLLPRFPDSCSGSADSPGSLEGTGVVSSWRMRCEGGLVGQTVAATGLAENSASVLFSLETRDGLYYQSLLSGDQPEFVIPGEPTAWEVMREYTWLGAEHIWGGIDHLLFVFGLLLLVGWSKRLIWTITAFTAGHSVTLTLVTLGFFDYPVALVEFMIALSIFLLALDLARRDGRGLFRRHPWWLAGGFGLLHGMGFAGALAEVGLPQSELPLALLFFNIGIELGQLTFIAVVAAFGALLVRMPVAELPAWRALPVYLLGSLSAMWCIERAQEVI
jgi:hypothetical protein